MKILVNFTSAKSGGALSYLRNIVPEWDQLLENGDAECEICLVLLESQRALISTPSNLSVYTVPDFPSPLTRIAWERWSLPQIAKRQSSDVLYTPYQVGPYVTGVTNVAMIRNMEPFYFNKYRYSLKTKIRNHLLRWLSRKTLNKADRVLACSRFSYDYCAQDLAIASNKISHVYHGRDAQFSPVQQPTDLKILQALGVSKPYIFTAGSMLPYRKCEDVIIGFSKSNLMGQVSLVIAGSGTDSGYATTIEDEINKVSGQEIKMLGQVSPEQMRVLYRHCSVFVTATQIEACPNIAIEAMSSGAKIVSSDAPPLPEMFAGCAQYFNASLGGEGLALLLNEVSLANIEKNTEGLQRASEFSWTACAIQTLNILKAK